MVRIIQFNLESQHLLFLHFTLTRPSRKSKEIQHYDVDDRYHHKQTQPLRIPGLRKDEPKRKDDQNYNNQAHD